MPLPPLANDPGGGLVSTGRLPASERVSELVAEAHARFRAEESGAVSRVYPALARVPSSRFSIAVASVNGELHQTGDVDHAFTLMSVSKPFVFALVCAELGPDEVRDRIGVDATGFPFDSAAAIERSANNPMVNAGAIATTSLVPGRSSEEKWEFIAAGFARFAGRKLDLDRDIYESASASNHRNQALAQLLKSVGKLDCVPAEAVDLYTRQCALRVTVRDLAVMGATLADGGVQPATKQAVVRPSVCHHTLAVMVTAGMYETSGAWFYDVGLPAKSGISGGIVTVSPGKGALATFAPKLDAVGNSVKGQHVARFLSRQLGMDLLASQPFT